MSYNKLLIFKDKIWRVLTYVWTHKTITSIQTVNTLIGPYTTLCKSSFSSPSSWHPLQPPGPRQLLLPVTIDYFAVFRILCKWNNNLCNPFCLASFTQYSYSEIHPYCGIYQDLIPCYCWVVFHCIHISVYPFTC